MNLSTVAILLLAWQMLSDKSSNKPQDYLSQFLNDDSKNILECVGKLSDSNVSSQDKTGAIFQVLTNPAVSQLANSLFNKTTEQTDTNSEGYKFDTPSQHSKEFFEPIDNIADAEIKHKLYWFYDNWYL